MVRSQLLIVLTFALLSDSPLLADTETKKERPPRIVFIEATDMT